MAACPLPGCNRGVRGAVVSGCESNDRRRFPQSHCRSTRVGGGARPLRSSGRKGCPEEQLDRPSSAGKAHAAAFDGSTTVLALYMPVSWMPYRWLRNLSCGIEWACLLATILVCKRSIPTTEMRLAFLIFATVCVAASDFWRIHVERGQIYVFHTLPLALGLAWSLRDKRDSWRAGIMFGLATALRPNLGLFIPGLLILGRKKSTLAATATAMTCVLMTLPFASPEMWQNYLAMGDIYYQSLSDPASIEPALRPPAVISVEGYATTGDVFLDHPVLPTSVAVWLSQGRTGVNWGFVCKLSLLILGGATLGILALLRSSRSIHDRLREQYVPILRAPLALLTAAAIATEFFLPQRWTYCDVILLPLLALAWPWFTEHSLGRMIAIVLLPAWILSVSGLPASAEIAAATWRAWGTVAGIAFLAAAMLKALPRLPPPSA
ncbi:MAG: glycosyltransferase family 87 protein [Gemmataceae bacterium]